MKSASIRMAVAVLVLWLGGATTSSAYEVLDNSKLRFGTGAEASVNVNGNLQQPFYYDVALSGWYKLTFSNYPLDNAIGIGGDGSSEWNLNGGIVENSALAGQVLDVSGYTVTSASTGYGTIVSTGTVTINGATLELRNTYTLEQDASFVKITTRLTNTSGSDLQNVRVWVGTRDDWVGTSDQPTKQRGNLVGGSFTPISNSAEQAPALMITSGASGVLFYSTSPKAHTSIASCCSFANSYQLNPATAPIQATNDGSYALFVRMNDLADGEGEEFTWYYAAGAVSELDDVAEEVANDASWTVTTSGPGGTISPASAQVRNGETAAFTVTPDEGHTLTDVQGCGGTLAGNTYTTGVITAECVVTASFTLNSYTVTAGAGAGGSISPGSAAVDHGETTSFMLTPANGYSIADVQGCDGTLAGNTYTTGAITGACAVTASFALSTYGVTASAGAGGSIGPDSATVTHGESTAFTITPGIGYSIADVQGCGGTLVGNTYTTGAITGACAVTANFALSTYSVTASAGTGGSISPTTTNVAHGNTAAFNVTPADGYSVASVTGCGGSLSGNTYTTAAVIGSCSVVASFTTGGPTFQPSPLPVYDLSSTELMTQLPDNMAPRAFDANGQELQVTLVGDQTRFAPGVHTLTWRAVDSRGVISTIEQTLRVWPIVSMGPDVSIGFRQGNSSSFRISLNGPAPQYPFTVAYEVSGYLQGHDIESGSVQLETGESEKEALFAILQTPAAGTPDQQVTVRLSGAQNPGARDSLVVELLTANSPPAVQVAATQEGERRSSFGQSLGPITLRPDIVDPDSGDTHTVRWESPPGAIVTASGNDLIIEPGSLPPGIHRFVVVVEDNSSPPQTTQAVIEVVVVASPRPLPDGVTAVGPNGLPDHPQYSPSSRNVLPEREAELTSYLIETEAGLQLALGAHAAYQGKYQSELQDMQSSALLPDTIVNVGGYFDFLISGLSSHGQSVAVVIPQRAAIPATPVYRKYDRLTQQWHTFVEGSGNALASARGAAGHCPPPASNEFRPGLNAGDWCVRVTISDGGPNDADGQANATVADPGGVGTLSTVVVTGTGKGNGGGSMGPLFVLIGLPALLLWRSRAARRRARSTAPNFETRSLPTTHVETMPMQPNASARFALMIATAAALGGLSLPAEASDSDQKGLRVGARVGSARGDVSENDVNSRLAAAGLDAIASFDDRTRTAWQVNAAYDFTANFGLAVGYTDLGETRTRLTGNVIDVEEALAVETSVHPHSADGYEMALTGRYPLLGRLFVTGRVGALRWESRYRARNIDGRFHRRESSGTDELYGLGVEMALFGRWTVLADYNRYKIDKETIDFASLGVTFRIR